MTDSKTMYNLTLCICPLDDSSSSMATSIAAATCVQSMPQLRVLQISGISPLPVLQSLSHRGSPLDTVTVLMPQLVCQLPILHGLSRFGIVSYLHNVHTCMRIPKYIQFLYSSVLASFHCNCSYGVGSCKECGIYYVVTGNPCTIAIHWLAYTLTLVEAHAKFFDVHFVGLYP